MDFKGRIVRCQTTEETIIVQRAEVTDERIALDWIQGGRAAFLIAKSANGSHFQGRLGYQQEKLDFECELTLFTAQNEELLYGTWREHDADRHGTLAIRLAARNFGVRTATGTVPEVEECAIGPGPDLPLASEILAVSAAVMARTDDSRPARPVPGAMPTTALRAMQLSSGQIDHLLTLSDEQFHERGSLQIEQELLAAPVPALFKLAHNAVAVELRALAARMFADRYSPAPESSAPARPPRAKESPEMRAQKRRSSRHGRNN